MPEFQPLPVLSDVILVTTRRFEDERGFFTETYNAEAFADGGITEPFVQDNYSLSEAIGTLRGLHYQKAPRGQAKLVRCISGRLMDVVVDIRPGSATFGKHESIELSAEDGAQLYIPEGFAHGFCTLEPNTGVTYKVTDFYSKAHDAGLMFNDPDLAIDWPFAPDKLTLSAKDLKLPRFADASFHYQDHSANAV